MATHVGRNFCLAPYTQITYTPWGNYSPCAEIGGKPWKSNESIVKLWSSAEFNSLRNEFSNNNKSATCQRCWDQESFKNQSLRKRLFTYSHLKEDILNFVQEEYKQGPKQINLMTGNLCNLRCRICTANLSVTYNIEGEHYEKILDLTKSSYTSVEKKQVSFSKQQIQEIVDISNNLIRLEFYGGEPLLDASTLDLLEKLVENGKNKDITLFYNTNGTVKPKDRHYNLWNKFKGLEFNLSYDDVGDRFTYQRHPADWQQTLNNLKELQEYPWVIPVQYQIICTISVFNVYYIDEIIAEFKKLNIPIFLNILDNPKYYNILYLPTDVKLGIHEKLKIGPTEIGFIKNMLLEKIENNFWEDFKAWTKVKDSYRKEDFSKVFPEYYKLLHEYDNSF